MPKRKSWYETKRYSGQLNIYIAYIDNLNSWKVSIVNPEKKSIVDYYPSETWIKQERKSVDCSEAYDYAAKTALSFAWNDHASDIEPYISTDDEGNVYVARMHYKAYWQWKDL
jgi:hypothetical protein